jgi:tRNA uridine 5-carboxymethylaminomethyl modification enzyme
MSIYGKKYDLIVVGAGHAGCEAALAGARMGCRTLVLTINVDNIGMMPCNPSVGGLAKSHLVKEVDALGGEIGKNADKTGIQFRTLNTRKGPAVQATRAQVDKHLYRLSMKTVLENQPGLDIKQAIVEQIVVKNGKVAGVVTDLGMEYQAEAVILTTGTFLNGLIHIGQVQYSSGRAGEVAAVKLTESLRELGFEIGRLKTGTNPRLDAKTIDFSTLQRQPGDPQTEPFSLTTTEIPLPQIDCYMTHTNPRTHEIIRANLAFSPLYNGTITGTSARYCPSLEDKVVKFAEREQHRIFLEPEGLQTREIYTNGTGNSLPLEVQLRFLRTIKGLEAVEIMRPGYAIEYDFVLPTQLHLTLETRLVEGLYHAGQINGTSGYEEAAAQGIMAGINAVLKLRGEPPFILDRSEAYIGVMLDDLVTRGTQEPYRMFTSRAEYRLLLRQDNADVRLLEKGYRLGLISDEQYAAFQEKCRLVEAETQRLRSTWVKPTAEVNAILARRNTPQIEQPITLEQLLKRPQLRYADIQAMTSPSLNVAAGVARQVEVQMKYEGYIKRQFEEVQKFKKFEHQRIPDDFNYDEVQGLSRELRTRLDEVRPRSLGQASRIAGITPAAISILAIWLKKWKSGQMASEDHEQNLATAIEEAQKTYG